jgi:hypothetical protein
MLRETHRNLKSAKVRSLAPIFTQLIEISREENFSDEEIVEGFAEALSTTQANQYLVGAILAAATLSRNKESGKND